MEQVMVVLSTLIRVSILQDSAGLVQEAQVELAPQKAQAQAQEAQAELGHCKEMDQRCPVPHRPVPMSSHQ
jgi:hypothetical protein